MGAGGSHGNRTELRKTRRRHFDYRARIQEDKDARALACAISDISASGARLNLKDDVDLPDSFFLLLTPNGAARRRCRLIWRDGLTVGVEFPENR